MRIYTYFFVLKIICLHFGVYIGLFVCLLLITEEMLNFIYIKNCTPSTVSINCTYKKLFTYM